jgi:hypothetical protein
MKRLIHFDCGDTGHVLSITKVSRIHGDIGLFHIDKIKDGYRITYSTDMIKDLQLLNKIIIIREN